MHKATWLLDGTMHLWWICIRDKQERLAKYRKAFKKKTLNLQKFS